MNSAVSRGEALCCIWNTIDGDDDIAKRLAGVRASGHPEAEYVASSVEAFAASGAPLTIRQGVQLKVALKYAKPPVWRSVIPGRREASGRPFPGRGRPAAPGDRPGLTLT